MQVPEQALEQVLEQQQVLEQAWPSQLVLLALHSHRSQERQ